MLRIFKKVGAEVEKAMHETEAEFRQDDVPKTLEKSGKKPVLAVSAIAQGIRETSKPSQPSLNSQLQPHVHESLPVSC